MDELSFRRWAVWLPWQTGPGLGWLGPDLACHPGSDGHFRGVGGTLTTSPWGLSSGLRILNAQWTEAMEDKLVV